MRTLELTVEQSEQGLTVKTVLRHRLCLAAGLLSHLKFVPHAVRNNGRDVRLIDRVAAGDRLTVQLGEEGESRFVPAPLPLEILYEDEDLLIVNKPAGLTMHSSAVPSLGSAAAAYLGEDIPFRPVQRLDKGTGGVLCLAKNRYIHDRLRQMLHSDDFTREYLAIACGCLNPPSGCIDAPISKAADAAHRHFVTPDGLPSRTVYETVGGSGELSLLQLRLLTGRTHQIRVHLSHIGHPLLGDSLYGEADARISRPALHSRTLSLLHPLSGKRIVVSAPLPEDMAALFAAAETDI